MIAADRQESAFRPDLAFETLRGHRVRLVELAGQIAAVFKRLEIASGAQASRRLAERLESDRFRVMVLGEFKRGKSTFVNALLGQDVLPSKVVPCTAVITEIKWGRESRAVVHFRHPVPKRLPEKLPAEVLANLRRSGGGRVPPLEIPVHRLREFVEIAEPEKEQAQSIAESPYEKVEIYWPLELCRNGVEIIDSPGLNEHESRARITADYLRQADAVLFVMLCTALGGMAELSFIDGEIRGTGHEQLFFICNRWDDVSPNEREEVRRLAYAKLGHRTLFAEAGIFFLSAREALQGRLQRDGRRVDASGLLPLEKKLIRFLAEERGKVKLTQPARELASQLQELKGKIIPAHLRMLDQSLEDLLARVEKVRPLLDEAERRKAQILQNFDNQRRILALEAEAAVEEFLRGLAPSLVTWAEETETRKLRVWTIRPLEQIKEVTAEAVTEAQERLRAELASWVKEKLEPLCADWLKRMEEELGGGLDKFYDRLDEIHGILTLEAPAADEVTRSTERKRMIASSLLLIMNPSIALQSRMGFNKYLVASLAAHVVAAIALTPFFGPFAGAVAALIAGEVAGRVGMEGMTRDVKKKAGEKLRDQLQADIPEIKARTSVRLNEQTGEVVVEAARLLDNEIGGVRERVAAVLRDKKAGEAQVEARKRLLAQVEKEVSEAAAVLREIVTAVARS